jgi:hypothetical protein
LTARVLGSGGGLSAMELSLPNMPSGMQ